MPYLLFWSLLSPYLREINHSLARNIIIPGRVQLPWMESHYS